jgi:hypothetical protein
LIEGTMEHGPRLILLVAPFLMVLCRVVIAIPAPAQMLPTTTGYAISPYGSQIPPNHPPFSINSWGMAFASTITNGRFDENGNVVGGDVVVIGCDDFGPPRQNVYGSHHSNYVPHRSVAPAALSVLLRLPPPLPGSRSTWTRRSSTPSPAAPRRTAASRSRASAHPAPARSAHFPAWPGRPGSPLRRRPSPVAAVTHAQLALSQTHTTRLATVPQQLLASLPRRPRPRQLLGR